MKAALACVRDAYVHKHVPVLVLVFMLRVCVLYVCSHVSTSGRGLVVPPGLVWADVCGKLPRKESSLVNISTIP